MAEGDEQARGGGSREGPDPSSLTTAALLREIATLKEQFRTDLAGEVKVLEAKIIATEKAALAFKDQITQVPTEVEKAVSNLQALHAEKFAAVEKQFQNVAELRNEKFVAVQVQLAERDTKVSETALATRTAVDAALAAAEKARTSQAESFALAAGKAEAAFAKALEQQSALSQTTTAALRDQIDDVKERVQRIEGQAIGKLDTKVEQHGSSSFIVGLVGLGLAIISALIAASAFIRPGR